MQTKIYNKIYSLSLALLLMFAFIPSTHAAALSTLSDTMTRIQISSGTDVYSNHTIQFTSPTGVASGATVRITFPNAGTANDFEGQSGIDYTDVDVADDGGEVALAATPSGATWGAAFSGTYNNILTLTNGTTVVAGNSVIRVRIGTNAVTGVTGDRQMGNPTTNGSKTIVIDGTFGDTGSIAVPISTYDQVVINASVDPSISFQISSNTAALGTLTTGAVAATSAITLTMGTNAASGYVVTIQDQGSGAADGLFKGAAPTYLIDSATGNLAAGTEGYGVAATTGTGSPSITAPYNQGGGNPVGALQRTPQSMVTYTGPTGATNQTATIVVRAAISASTPAGTYADTLTLIMTGNF